MKSYLEIKGLKEICAHLILKHNTEELEHLHWFVKTNKYSNFESVVLKGRSEMYTYSG